MKGSTGRPSLVELSDQLATAVEHAARSVVAVHARPRIASSGVHWRDGIILTTDATVRRDADIVVTLPDGRSVPATLQGRDAASDLAALRIAKTELPAAELGDPGTLRPGHIVLAIARLDDSGPRVSFGALSATGGPWRTWKGAEYDLRLQSGLELYPGFGGGPLIDVAGRVHGINSGGLSRAFATTIPVGTIERVLVSLLSKGYVPRSWLGVGMQPVRLSAPIRKKLGLANEDGLLIVSVEPEGPAARGGLLVGDVILSMDGHALGDPEDVVGVMGSETVGRKVTLDVVRGGTRDRVDVTIGERPDRRERTHARQG